MKNFYEVNQGTICLIKKDKNKTRVIELDEDYIINKNINKIMNDSCKSFGSSLKGRVEGTYNLTGIKYKAPIVLSEYLSIIMIPTGSTRGEKCDWINLKYIEKISSTADNKCIINFINGKNIKFNVSYFIIQNQLTKATRLDYNLRKKYERKN